MRYVRLLANVSWPHLRRRWLRMALMFASVMQAVCLFAAMHVTEYSIVRSFERSNDALFGGATHVVRRGVGVDEETLASLESIAGVRAAPVIQRNVVAVGPGTTLTVLGIDLARDPRLRRYRAEGRIDPLALLLERHSVVVPRSLATAIGLTLGGELSLSGGAGAQRFVVVGIVADTGPALAVGGRIVVMTAGAARELFGIAGGFDRIDLAIGAPATEEAVGRALPAGSTLEVARRRDNVLDFSVGQMRSISLAVALVAMMIGLFIIYNSMSLSVVERTAEIGTLRALGARRRDVVGLLATEAIILGIPASLAGVGIGSLLARETIRAASTSINMMVRLVESPAIEVPPDVWLVAPWLGVLTALGGTVMPALAAAGVSPIEALGRTPQFRARAGRLLAWLVLSVPLGWGSIALGLRPEVPREVAVAGFVGAILAVALALPQLVVWLAAGLRLAARRALGIEAYLAFDQVVKHPSRSALTLVALAGSLSLIVAARGVLWGFDRATGRWMDRLFSFELSIQVGPMAGSAYPEVEFPDSVREVALADPRVVRVAGTRCAPVAVDGRTVMLVGFDSAAFWGMAAERGAMSGAEADAIVAGLQRGAVGVSENFARLNGVRVGDRITLPVPGGTRVFEVDHVIEDYSWPSGIIMMDRAVYASTWRDRSLTFLDVQLHDPAETDAVQSALTLRLAGHGNLSVNRTADIKAFAGGLIRDWFRLADAQVLLALVIGGVGVANTLLMSLLGQSRQIGLLRAVGATRGQVRRVLVGEAAMLGAASAVLGVLMGLFVAAVLVPALIERESGYRFPLVMPWASVIKAAGAGVGIALLASVLPLRAARRFDVVRAISFE